MDKLNFNKSADTSNTGVSTTYQYQNPSCVHRLPCGYCPLLGRTCPMQTVTITNEPYINTPWNLTEVTCKTGGTE